MSQVRKVAGWDSAFPYKKLCIPKIWL